MNVWYEHQDILQKLCQDLLSPSKRCIVFIGSGISKATPAEIPTWKEMFLQLCDYCIDLDLQEVVDNLIKIAELADYKPQFLTLCFEDLRTAMGNELYETSIKRILSPKNPGIPNTLQRLVVIPFEGIITTNIDELLDMAAEEALKSGTRPMYIKKYTSFSDKVQETISRKIGWLWKIHGTIQQPETWIFTSSEYSNSIYKNHFYREALRDMIQGSRLVFIGFGGSDHEINQILTCLGDQFGGREDPHILFTRDKKGLDIHYLSSHNIHVIEYGGPEDHSTLTKLLDKFPHYSYTKQAYTDFDDTAYRKWLIGETHFIDIRGIGVIDGKSAGVVRFPVLELYTKLYVRDKPTNLDLEFGRIRGGQRVELIEMANETRCLAIVGDPGSGKTTFLRYLARNLLSDPNGLLPIYLRLGDVYDYFVKQKKPQLEPQILLEFLVFFGSKYNLNLTLTGLEKKIKNGQCCFLLDALDELPSTTVREDIVQVVDIASSLWNDCKFIITSRPLAMTGKSIPISFELVGIDQLHDNEIRSFLETWTKLIFPHTSEDIRQYHSDSLLGTIRERPEIHQLARNPVMLTSMAVIHYNEKRLPEGRADLLEAVIQWLLHAKDRSSNSGRRPSIFTEEIYRKIALAMFDVDGIRKIRIGRGWIAKNVAMHFGNDERKALDFIKREETDTGILVRRGEGDLAFWHSSFQEYLAAKEIAGKTDNEDDGWWSVLQKNIDKTEWREVICLVPACLVRLGTDRVNLFFSRLSNQYLDKNLSGKARGVSIGGCILEDLRVYGYQPTDVSLWAKILVAVKPIFESSVQSISLEERYNAAVAYGLGGDDRLRDFEKTWITLPGGTFFMGTQAKDRYGLNYDPDSMEWEQPIIEVNLPAFEIRKYHITVKEFELFISDGGYDDDAREFWLQDGKEWRSKNEIYTPRDWDRQLSFPNCPVSGISWFEAVAYCRWLTSNNELRNVVYQYRLPSEAEWEYAARHGLPSEQRFPWGNDLNEGELSEANWVGCNLHRKTPVGMFPKSNTRDSIADMIGNVEEWCADSWCDTHENYPKNGMPRWISTESGCVVRGGSTIRVSRLCRLAHRSRCNKDGRYETIGFRPVRVLMGEK